jgi:hypothetical protein
MSFAFHQESCVIESFGQLDLWTLSFSKAVRGSIDGLRAMQD